VICPEKTWIFLVRKDDDANEELEKRMKKITVIVLAEIK